MKLLKINNKGITIVSLIVTIIVLIILAGISINLLIGDNDIIKIAKDARTEQNIARLQEKLELLKGNILIDKMKVDLNTYLEELNNYTEKYQVKYIEKEEGSDVAYVVLEEKYKFQIKDEKNGNVKITYNGIDSNLLLSETSGTLIYPEERTITVVNNTSGGELSIKSSNEAIATATISGNEIIIKSGTTPGTATITVTSAAKGNYAEQKATYEATVNRGTIEISATAYTGNYDGTSHEALTSVSTIPSGTTITYGLDGNTASYPNYPGIPKVTGADTYSVSVSATKAGYAPASKTITVTVGKQQNTTGNLLLSETSGTLTYPSTKTFTVNTNVSEGDLSVTSSDTSVAEVSISGTTVTITPKEITEDGKKTTITVTSAAKGNYAEQTATYEATVNRGTIEISATAYIGNYDGTAHEALTSVSTTPSGTTITYGLDGNTASYPNYPGIPKVTGANTYSVSVSATKTGYAPASKTITVTVGKQQNTTGNLVLSETSGTLTYPSTKTFTVKTNVSDGDLSVTSSDTSVATASISGTTVTITPKAITEDGKKTTITVKSAAKGNYEEQTTTYEATVNRGTLSVTATAYSAEYDGKAHGITVTCDGATITYATSSGGTYSSTKPTYTAVGTYTTHYKVAKAGYKTVTDSKTVTIKDTKVPDDATITISGTKTQTSLPVTLSAKVTHTDAASGVKIASCKYILNTSSTALGTTASKYTGGTFSSNGQTITIKPSSATKWYLHVLTVDNSGNAKETIKGPITVTSNYHTHSGKSSAVGGCYGNKVGTRNVICGCTGSHDPYWPSWSDCPLCNKCSHNSWAHDGVDDNNVCPQVTGTENYTYIDLICGKNTSTIESYTISY